MNIFYIEALAHVVAIIVGLFTIIIGAKEFALNTFKGKRKKRHEDYEFTKKFLNEINRKENGKEIYEHPFLIEKGFYALSGKKNLSAEEILYCLNQKNPIFFFEYYPLVRRKYVEYSHHEKLILFKGNYRYSFRRWLSRAGNYILFFIYFCFAYFLIISIFSDAFRAKYAWSWWQTALTLNISILFLFGIAIMCMTQGIRLTVSEELVAQQGNDRNEYKQKTNNDD